jgi:hypothetical protein
MYILLATENTTRIVTTCALSATKNVLPKMCAIIYLSIPEA